MAALSLALGQSPRLYPSRLTLLSLTSLSCVLQVHEDVNKDGIIDIVHEDTDKDGKPNLIHEDVRFALSSQARP